MLGVGHASGPQHTRIACSRPRGTHRTHVTLSGPALPPAPAPRGGHQHPGVGTRAVAHAPDPQPLQQTHCTHPRHATGPASQRLDPCGIHQTPTACIRPMSWSPDLHQTHMACTRPPSPAPDPHHTHQTHPAPPSHTAHPGPPPHALDTPCMHQTLPVRTGPASAPYRAQTFLPALRGVAGAGAAGRWRFYCLMACSSVSEGIQKTQGVMDEPCAPFLSSPQGQCCPPGGARCCVFVVPGKCQCAHPR